MRLRFEPLYGSFFFVRIPVNAVKKNFHRKIQRNSYKNSPLSAQSTLKDAGALRWKKFFFHRYSPLILHYFLTKPRPGCFLENFNETVSKYWIRMLIWYQDLVILAASRSINIRLTKMKKSAPSVCKPKRPRFEQHSGFLAPEKSSIESDHWKIRLGLSLRSKLTAVITFAVHIYLWKEHKKNKNVFLAISIKNTNCTPPPPPPVI